jgi:hypothetical protein
VVLSGRLVADPRMVRDLHSEGVPHLPVRVRDGTGLVGPLMIPGVTSCLVNLGRNTHPAPNRMRYAATKFACAQVAVGHWFNPSIAHQYFSSSGHVFEPRSELCARN